MKYIDVLRIAFRMLRTNLLRSLLTVLGIGIAISFIVILIGLGYGIQNVTIGSIVRSQSLLSLDVKQDEKGTLPLNDSTIKDLGAKPGVTAVSPVVVTSGQVTIDGHVAAVTVNSGNNLYMGTEGVEIKNGRNFKDDAAEIVVSPQTADLLNLTTDQVLGSTVSLSYNDPNNNNETKKLDNLLIVGISSSTDSPDLYVPYGLITHDGPVKLSSIRVVAKNRDAVVSIRNATTAKGYLVDSLVDTLDQAKKVFSYATIGLVTFGAIALVVASIGMFNTLTIALIERTREIGIMKSIGVTDKTVRALFLAEAGIIGFMGGVTGVIIGTSTGLLLETLLNYAAQNNQGSVVQLFQYPPGFLLGIIIFPILLSMLTGLYPAIRASRLNPLQALRYE